MNMCSNIDAKKSSTNPSCQLLQHSVPSSVPSGKSVSLWSCSLNVSIFEKTLHTLQPVAKVR